MTLEEAFGRLASVREELQASTFAVGYVIRSAARDPTILDTGRQRVKLSQLRRCANHLSLTYVVRLFAEFETILRDYLAAARQGVRRRTSMETLMDRIAAIRTIPPNVRLAAHEVRQYRNAVLHHRAIFDAVTFDQCKTKLSHFLSYLPPKW